MVSRILICEKKTFENFEYVYMVWTREGSLWFYGVEKENGKEIFSQKMGHLPYDASEVCFFLGECIKSVTAPRMIEELMADRFG